jgi:ClpP class serine protease
VPELLQGLFWWFLVASFLIPMLRQRIIEAERIRVMRSLEQRRDSRVITMIHRQESITLLGVPIYRYLTMEDSEQVLRAIRLTPAERPIDIILHTPGGLALAATQIAYAIRKHPAPVTVFVPHYAMSGGTLVALAANELAMDENAALGPIDPQLMQKDEGPYPAPSLLAVVAQKGVERVDDKTLLLADIADKSLRQVRSFVAWLLSEPLGTERASQVAEALTDGRWTHDYPLTTDSLREMGLAVRTDLPGEVYRLMELYPQPIRRQPAVEYLPVPGPAPTVPRQPARR